VYRRWTDWWRTITRINVYRIVQESLNDIIKHSGAARASVDVSGDGGDLVITITDNGKGFDTKAARTDTIGSGFGLAGVAERVGAALAGERGWRERRVSPLSRLASEAPLDVTRLRQVGQPLQLRASRS
jgi:LytS/YehU family sensor histidine kinase